MNNTNGFIQISGFRKGEQEIWISKEQWFSPIEITDSNMRQLPVWKELLCDLIEKWRSKAQEMHQSWGCDWYVKGAAIRFLYKDQMYLISPSVIDASPELFEHMSYDMEQELKRRGCIYTSYLGTID